VSTETTSTAPRTADELEPLLEEHRGELTGYCYRMLGSAFEAEDAVQETMVRAWRALDRFQGRSSLRSWLYRIATNVCLDMIGQRERRAMPMDMGPAADPVVEHLKPLQESAFVEPIPDALVRGAGGDPADHAVARETLRLAFVAALQHLPPRQRAVLILREVLQWQASEVSQLLDTSVQSVNSSLQRARATIAGKRITDAEPLLPHDERQRELLGRYLAAFERYDMEALTALLAEDATQCMPPYDMWLHGRDDLMTWWFGPGIGCKGSRLVPTVANGLPAFGQYRPSGPGGAHEPWALQILELRDGAIVGFTAYLDTARMFPLFGLPPSPSA
jgi:RNA polymerase sigma-70 factor (ECF subfamily)